MARVVLAWDTHLFGYGQRIDLCDAEREALSLLDSLGLGISLVMCSMTLACQC